MTEPSRAVFLSYASQDAEAAEKICEALRAAGIEVWFDRSELRGGDAWGRVQLGQTAALYFRVSTADQTCARQERDLRAFAKKAGYKTAGVWKETASGAKDDLAERKEVLALAQARKIDVTLVTELTRWGRSMLDLFHSEGQSYREISHRLGLSKNTVLDIVKRDRAA